MEVSRHDRLLTGEEPNIEELLDEDYKRFMAGEPDRSIILTYSNSLEKAEGYAQGALDAIQATAGLAGRST